jgi:alpha-beta hydrolase superfamily lysophospholipase
MIHSIALLILVLVGVGATVVVVVAHLMAEGILRPPRMTDGKAVYVLKRLSPGDLGMGFSEERFLVRDCAYPNGGVVEIAGWWIAAEKVSEKCVVLLHGYADAKVGSIAWGPLWRSMGFHILAIDLRAHGESGGRDSTAGFYERHDVNEVIDQARSRWPGETREMVLFGVSMGAAVAVATAVMREDLAAVVIDSPFADYRGAIRQHLDRLGLPGGVVGRLAIWLAQVNSGADFAAVRPVKSIGAVACPVMMIRGEGEDFVSAAECTAMDAAMRRRGRAEDAVWIGPGAGHLGGLQCDPEMYRKKVEAFLIGGKVLAAGADGV